FQQTTKYDWFKVDDANMEVKKITNMSGDVHYQANVKVDYRYTYKDGRSS
ncbi:acyl-CoA synthetase, partial [Vibrio lentus]